MVEAPPPMRTSNPPEASRATCRASAGVASMKWNVVPPCISIDGLGWCASTNTGVWKGGSSPHQPFHSSSIHWPRWGPNLLRPMISAPMPGPQLLAKASSTPVLPPDSPHISRNVRVGKNHHGVWFRRARTELQGFDRRRFRNRRVTPRNCAPSRAACRFSFCAGLPRISPDSYRFRSTIRSVVGEGRNKGANPPDQGHSSTR